MTAKILNTKSLRPVAFSVVVIFFAVEIPAAQVVLSSDNQNILTIINDSTTPIKVYGFSDELSNGKRVVICDASSCWHPSGSVEEIPPISSNNGQPVTRVMGLLGDTSNDEYFHVLSMVVKDGKFWVPFGFYAVHKGKNFNLNREFGNTWRFTDYGLYTRTPYAKPEGSKSPSDLASFGECASGVLQDYCKFVR